MVLDFDGASCHQCKPMAKRGAKAKYMQKVIGVVVGDSGWVSTTFQRPFNDSSTDFQRLFNESLRLR